MTLADRLNGNLAVASPIMPVFFRGEEGTGREGRGSGGCTTCYDTRLLINATHLTNHFARNFGFYLLNASLVDQISPIATDFTDV